MGIICDYDGINYGIGDGSIVRIRVSDINESDEKAIE